MATTHVIRDDSPLPVLPRRAVESNKGTYGRALLVGGARGMTGAIGLAGMACLRAGAGLVELAVARSCQPIVAGYEPSYMTVGLAEDAEGRLSAAALDELCALADKATALGCGPGLALTDETTTIALALYASYARAAVFDADALNALARHPEQLSQHAGPRVLTPHPGEFGRLTGKTVAEIQGARIELASNFARQHNVVVILKGHQSCITDGRRIALNTTGNPGMATGGTGDVLTGILTALLAQGLEPYDAARLAAHLHGLSGDLAAAELGETSLIASDLVRHLPAAFVEHERRSGA
ncbi:MAG: NAD(P)H-hydrate dehydratase [Planctomycetaceae bacterium]|nr:NAD(P)H-hydrate dehydratase [Planctomycetaceae bacterium]